MSRTVKRKNLERDYRPHQDGYSGGSSIAGYYTEYDLVSNFRGYIQVYREPTKDERFKRWQAGHSERKRRHNSKLTKAERKIEQQRHRTRVREKIQDIAHGLVDPVAIAATPYLHPSWWW